MGRYIVSTGVEREIAVAEPSDFITVVEPGDGTTKIERHDSVVVALAYLKRELRTEFTRAQLLNVADLVKWRP